MFYPCTYCGQTPPEDDEPREPAGSFDCGRCGQRFSYKQRIGELVGEIELAGGYVRISSTQGIIGQMLFGVIGPDGIQLFSAVPPTVVL